MSFIKFGHADRMERQSSVMGNSLVSRQKPTIVKVGGDEVGGGGFSRGLGQGFGIGVGLLTFGAVFAFLKGKRIG
jgi:hypothetical protein